MIDIDCFIFIIIIIIVEIVKRIINLEKIMDFNDLLRKPNCVCGKDHACSIEGVYIFNGAINKLTELLKEYNSVLLVADENTFLVAGDKVLNTISDKNVKKVIFSGKTVLIPNEKAIEEVERLINGVDVIIGIGSGVIQDLCKFVSYDKKVPYIIVATAPSMDGYASDGAAMITGGMKVTYKATVPKYIIAEPSILKNAPFEMIQAGYGDIVGKYSALNDWELAREINGEYFCKFIYDSVMGVVKQVVNCASGLVNRDEESVKKLMEALVIVGVMMSFAGSSRPASGAEHHMAHYFEITGIIDNKPYLPHGIDVGYSTVITAKIRRELLNGKWSFIRKEDVNYRNEKIKSIYKSSANECIKLQQKTGNYDICKISLYIEKEEKIKEILSNTPSPDRILKMLERVGLDISNYYNLYGDEKISDGILYSKDLKDRFTVFWLYYYFNKRKDIDKSKIKVIAFDLDGTLTQHRQPLPHKSVEMLKKLSKKYKLIMVGAGQVGRIFNQMDKFPIDIIGNYGMQYGEYDKTIKDIKMVKDEAVSVDRDSVTKKITALREKYGYTEFKGDSVEFHPSGCLTFPLLGTKADKDDKIKFDPDRKKRRKIYLDVCSVFSNYEVFVGGSSSFDMSPKGYNKYVALKEYAINNGLNLDNILYVGDDYGFGGNDEPVYLSNIPFLEIDNFETFSDKIKFLL